MKQNQMIITILIALLTAGAGFFAGSKYQEGKTPAFFRQMGNGIEVGNGQGNSRGTGMMQNGTKGSFRPVSGEIIKSDDTSITVKMTDGSTKIVFVNDKTSINTASSATKADLTAGQTVAVFGDTNTDGSVNATNIQLNPDFRGQGVSSSQPANSVK